MRNAADMRITGKGQIRFCVGLLLLFWGQTHASAEELSAQQIIARAVERAEEQRGAEPTLAYEATVESITEHLDGDGQVKKTERATYHQYPLEGVIYEELVSLEGTPLSGDDVRDEVQRRSEFAEEVRKRRAKGENPAPEDENRVDFDTEFVERYEFTIAGDETIDGHACWVLSLAPRPGKLPERRRIDTALNNSTGRVWVSKDDFGLARVEFEMAKSVKFWGGFLGTLRNTVGRLEFRRNADHVWLPTVIDIRLDLRILFKSIRRRIVREWDDYSPFLTTN